MQQWGGLTTLYESEEPTVVEFIKDVKYLEENSPNSRLDITYYREIKDTAIAKKICYGSGGWPENDADIIIASQGTNSNRQVRRVYCRSLVLQS